jgi:2-polyprenyl-6-methoxyphenol hydroxylase-like FAD-dependent oxidoreductase
MNRKIIIIGAGIAGPVLAIQLKCLGDHVEIFEARTDDQSGEGAFLGITPNGLNILKMFVPLGELKKEYTTGSMRFYNQKDKQIAELCTGYQKEKYGCETMQIKRAGLNKLIRQAAEEKGIRIHYGKKCIDVEEKHGYVQAKFEDGHIAYGDMLIACDGVFSTVRKLIFPQMAKPVYTKHISTGGYAQLPGLHMPDDFINMTFGERGFFAYTVSNRGDIWWFNNYYRENEPSRQELQTTLKEEIKDQLLQIHKNDNPLFAAIIRASTEIIAYPVYDIPKMINWYCGRICLLGDAAHATSPHIGQGASLALEDTVVLYNYLKQYNSPENAFKYFQKERQQRVEKIIKQARKVGNAKSKPNPVAVWFRDKLMGFFIKGMIKRMDWIYGYRVDMSLPAAPSRSFSEARPADRF